MSSPEQLRPLLLGHRGYRGVGLAENSFAAFDRALEDGCDGFEFDVRCTGDARHIICHDPKLRGREVARSPFDALRDSHSTPNSEDLPCLETVLQRYASRAFLDIELKVAGIEASVLAAIRAENSAQRYVISSFLPEVLLRLRELDSQIPLGFIFDDRAAMRLWSTLPVEWLMPNRKFVTRESIEEFHAAGKRVMAWTVNSPSEMLRFAEFRVDALVSDDPALLCKTLRPIGDRH